MVEGVHPIKWTDDYGEEHEGIICWDCEWDLANGRGDMNTDTYDIYIQRLADLYNEDPVNNAHLAKYAM